jgi:hypothetical protein
MADLFFLPFRPAFDANGVVVPGATLTFYTSGTNILQPVFAEEALVTPLANPLSANAAGQWPQIYIDSSKTYRVVLRSALGIVLNEVDPYYPGVAGEDGKPGKQGNPGGNAQSTGPAIDLPSQTVPTGTDQVITSGSMVPADGGSGRFKADSAVTQAYAASRPRSAAYLPNLRGFRLDEYQSLNILMFGATPSSVSNADAVIASNDAAIAEALAYITDRRQNPQSTARYYGTVPLRIPLGSYRVGTLIDLKTAGFTIYGDGNGMAGPAASELVFEPGIGGIRIQKDNTVGNTSGSITTGADGTTIRGLKLTGGVGSAGHGIHIRARAVIEDVWVEQFAGNGLNIVATAGAGGASEGNANTFQIRGGRLSYNRGSGMYVVGGDANSASVVGTDATGNFAWGFDDQSFLGNTYLAAHTAGNILGSYRSVNNNARNRFFNCYAESDQPPATIAYPAKVDGGLHPNGVLGTGLWEYTDASGRMITNFGFQAPGSTGTVQLGGSGAHMRMFGPNNSLGVVLRNAGNDWIRAIGLSDNGEFERVLCPGTTHHFGSGKVVFPMIGLGSQGGDSHRALSSVADPTQWTGPTDNGTFLVNNGNNSAFNAIDYWVRKNGAWVARP